MKQFVTICLLVSFTLLNAQNQELSKLKLLQFDLKKEILILNDSLLIINRKIDSLNKFIEEQIIQNRLVNLAGKDIITTTKEIAVLREKPFTNSKILKRIEPETQLAVKGYVNNYYECCIGEECGFIHVISLNENEKTTIIKESSNLNIDDYKKVRAKIKTADKFSLFNVTDRIYKHPSYQSLELANFSKDKVRVLSYSNGFLKVKDSSNKIGFIQSFSFGKNQYLIEKLNELTLKQVKIKEQKILIRGANVSNVNSAGGVEISIDWLYLNKNKDIKYIEFTFQGYNNVSDIQKSEIGNYTYFTGQVTGPIKASDEFQVYNWKNAWYNSTISCVKITKVKVIYMDESSYVYVNELPEIFDKNFSNSCN